MNPQTLPLPDASDIGLVISRFRLATPQWLVYEAKLNGKDVAAWRYLPDHARTMLDGTALWQQLPDWFRLPTGPGEPIPPTPQSAAFSEESKSGWIFYPRSVRVIDKPIHDRQMLADLANRLLAALDFLHVRSTLHLDVHPSNVRNVDGKIYLLGVGSDVRRAAGESNGSNIGLGRPRYSAPEMWDASGRSALGPWTDIYATAATLHAAICGLPPADFRKRMNDSDWQAAMRSELAETLARSGSPWPQMAEFIITALAPRPSDRPRSVTEWSQVWKGPSTPTAATPALQTPKYRLKVKWPLGK